MLEKSSQIISALKRPSVVAFAKPVFSASYEHYFPDHKKEVSDMINMAFELLLESQQQGDSPEKLKEATIYINKTIFRKQDPLFWFNTTHKQYKIKTRSQEDFKCIRPYIVGERVLDFGSNGGYFALELAKHGFKVITTDVLDYRDESAKHLIFRKMATSTDIPYDKDSADTAIVKTVFHHIEQTDLPLIFEALHKIAKRLIIKEDLYGVTKATPGLQDLLDYQPSLREYVALSKEDQYLFLVLVDYFGNAISHGLTEMNLSFDFKTEEEWVSLLEKNRFAVREVKYYGFDKTKLHNSLQAWIVCDRK